MPITYVLSIAAMLLFSTFAVAVGSTVNSTPPHLLVGRGVLRDKVLTKNHFLNEIDKSIAGLCDWIIITHTTYTKTENRTRTRIHKTEVIKQRSPPRTVYIVFMVDEYQPCCGMPLPHTPINKMWSLLGDGVITSPVVLFSGSTDLTFPVQTDTRSANFSDDFNKVVALIADSPLVERWNVENLAGPHHSKMVPFPVGFVHSGCEGHKGKQKLPATHQYPCDSLWNHITDHPPLAARPLTMMCTGRRRNNPQFQFRNHVMNHCKSHGAWGSLVPKNVPHVTHAQFIRNMKKVSFMLCPHGGGVDPSPKAFEALAVGTIPIVQRSDVYDAYKYLPIAWVDDFSEESISEAKLRAWRDELAPRFDNPEEAKRLAEQLTMRYWWGYAVNGTSAEAPPIFPLNRKAQLQVTLVAA